MWSSFRAGVDAEFAVLLDTKEKGGIWCTSASNPTHAHMFNEYCPKVISFSLCFLPKNNQVCSGYFV